MTELPHLSTERTTVVIADDHHAIREGVRMRLERDGFEVVGEAPDGPVALAAIMSLRPTVAVLDLRMPGMDGIEVAQQASSNGSRVRVVLLSATTDAQLVQRALDSGVVGYVGKDSSLDVLANAVREAARGGRFIDPTLVPVLLASSDERLTDRELEVLQLAANGMQNRAIAAQLQLSEETIKSHVSNVIRKLRATSRTEAVAAALRRSLIR